MSGRKRWELGDWGPTIAQRFVERMRKDPPTDMCESELAAMVDVIDAAAAIFAGLPAGDLSLDGVQRLSDTLDKLPTVAS